MEQKFYSDDFEMFLKDNADDFRMYPSKRVWNSLYNNLHPGRKWPSIGACMLLVSSIIFIGIAHQNEIDVSVTKLNNNLAPAPQIIATKGSHANTALATTTTPASQSFATTGSQGNTSNLLATNITPASDKTSNSLNDTHSAESVRLSNAAAANTSAKLAPGITAAQDPQKNTTNNLEQVVDQDLIAQNKQTLVSDEKSANINIVSAPAETYANVISNSEENSSISNTDANTVSGLEPNNDPVIIARTEKTMTRIVKGLTLPALKTNTSAAQKDWIENYAFENKPSPSFKSKLSYQFYLTPSVGYRTLAKNANYSMPARPSVLTSAPEEPRTIQHEEGFNLEAGLSFLLPYTKKLRFKGGIQLNYTNYRGFAFDQGHSSITTLLLNDPNSGGMELSQRSSTLANLPGSASDKKLNNSTVQISLPIGADIKLAGKNELQWFAGATLQPTYVLFGNAYLISSDMKNYVYDASFLRKWNVNAGIETFISYKTKKGVTLHAGPQFRYQLFSTYDKRYTYTERLYNVGAKIGMIKHF